MLSIQRCDLQGGLDRDRLPCGWRRWPAACHPLSISLACLSVGIRTPLKASSSPLRKVYNVSSGELPGTAFAGPWFRIVDVRSPTKLNSCSGNSSIGSLSKRSSRTCSSRIGFPQMVLGSLWPTTAPCNRCLRNPRTCSAETLTAVQPGPFTIHRVSTKTRCSSCVGKSPTAVRTARRVSMSSLSSSM